MERPNPINVSIATATPHLNILGAAAGPVTIDTKAGSQALERSHVMSGKDAPRSTVKGASRHRGLTMEKGSAPSATTVPATPTWWEWLVLTATKLAVLGVPKDEVSDLRFQNVGLRKPLSKRWARTVGLWGGQRTCAELAGLIGVEQSVVRSYAQYWGAGILKKGNPRKHQVEIALHAESMRRHYGAHMESHGGSKMTLKWMAGTACGILPPEYLYYIKEIPIFEDLIQETEGSTLAELVEEYEMSTIQEMWVASGASLVAPWGDEEDDLAASLAARLRS